MSEECEPDSLVTVTRAVIALDQRNGARVRGPAVWLRRLAGIVYGWMTRQLRVVGAEKFVAMNCCTCACGQVPLCRSMGGLPASVPPARHTHIHGYSRYGMRSARGMDERTAAQFG